MMESTVDGSLRLRVPSELAGPLSTCVGQDVEMEMTRDHTTPTGDVIAFHRIDGGDAVAAWDAWVRDVAHEWDGLDSLDDEPADS